MARGNYLAVRRRQELARNAGPKVEIPQGSKIIVADVSGSMGMNDCQEGKRRIDILREALAPMEGRAYVIEFGIYGRRADHNGFPSTRCTTPASISEPSGGTPMDQGLARAAGLEPETVLLMSDGRADDPWRAKDAAKLLAKECIIDTLFIGPSDPVGEQLLREIAEIGRGSFDVFDITKTTSLLLESKVESMLALPAPKIIEL